MFFSIYEIHAAKGKQHYQQDQQLFHDKHLFRGKAFSHLFLSGIACFLGGMIDVLSSVLGGIIGAFGSVLGRFVALLGSVFGALIAFFGFLLGGFVGGLIVIIIIIIILLVIVVVVVVVVVIIMILGSLQLAMHGSVVAKRMIQVLANHDNVMTVVVVVVFQSSVMIGWNVFAGSFHKATQDTGQQQATTQKEPKDQAGLLPSCCC